MPMYPSFMPPNSALRPQMTLPNGGANLGFLPPLPASSLALPISGSAPQMPVYSPATSSPPNPNYLGDIISAYQTKQQDQSQQGGFIQGILSNRLQPSRDDELTAYNQNTAALAAPNSFKSTTPLDVATDRTKLELAPFSKMGETPASVKEYQFYNSLSPTDKQTYLNVKRQQQFLNLGDRFTAPMTGETLTKGLPPQDLPSVRGAQSAATSQAKNSSDLAYSQPIAAATETGKNTALNQTNAQNILPDVINNANQVIKDINGLKNHPALDAIFGLRSVVPVIPGTPGADALARYKQLVGKTFLASYNQLRGGGSITEVEGSKATDALGRLDRAQSKEDAQQALSELSDVIANGVNVTKQKAGMQDQAPIGPNQAMGAAVNPPAQNGWKIERIQ